MAVFTADHYIRDQASLLAALDRGAALAAGGYLVTFGIPPQRLRPAMAISSKGPPLDETARVSCRKIRLKKPNLAKARASWPKAVIIGTAASSYFAGMYC